MRAVWYDEQGPAENVLRVGELPDPHPGPGEVRVRVGLSGVNPGDTKKRRGWLGSAMPFPRIVPHSDAAGTIDLVGDHVSPDRVGRRVWVFGAQSYRPFGTAAELTVVPTTMAVDLPDTVTDAVGACLGIPGITAHRAVYGDGPVRDRAILVHGVLGGVGSLAAQLARWGGAEVIGTVRRTSDLDEIDPDHRARTVALDRPDAAAAIHALTGGGVDRIVDVALSANAELDADVARNTTVIAAYGTAQDPTAIPFWRLLFDNVTIRLLGSDDFPVEAKRQAARDLTAAAAEGALSIPVSAPFPLGETGLAHRQVDAGGRGRTVVDCRA